MRTETLAIIGSGPAAWTAAIYAARKGIRTDSGVVGNAAHAR